MRNRYLNRQSLTPSSPPFPRPPWPLQSSPKKKSRQQTRRKRRSMMPSIPQDSNCSPSSSPSVSPSSWFHSTNRSSSQPFRESQIASIVFSTLVGTVRFVFSHLDLAYISYYLAIHFRPISSPPLHCNPSLAAFTKLLTYVIFSFSHSVFF
jgi:hypothetical protein